MNNKIIKYVISDLLRNRTVFFYTLVLLALSLSIFFIEDNVDKSIASLLNLVLFVVPLVSIVFSTIYLYNSEEFIALLVSQPLKRQSIWLSIFVGLATAMAAAFLVGVGLPTLIFAYSLSGVTLVIGGLFLSLFVVPLVSIVFSTIYLYNSEEFIALLVSQPLKRQSIWLSIFVGLATAMAAAFLVGVGLPTLIFAYSLSGVTLVIGGLFLSLIFVSIAMWTAVRLRDKSKGIGLAIILWLYFALIFDALLLFLLFQFADYPIEKLMVAVSMLNPIDISRILILLEIDLSAMMGYTGAIFRDFFGTGTGMLITGLVMFLWIALPLLFATRFFKRKDL